MSAKKKPYTKKQYDEFSRLVRMSESPNQIDRIKSLLDFPAFIEKAGKEKCDLMFEQLKKEPY